MDHHLVLVGDHTQQILEFVAGTPDEHDVGAFGNEVLRRGRPDPGAGTGDDNGLVGKAITHNQSCHYDHAARDTRRRDKPMTGLCRVARQN